MGLIVECEKQAARKIRAACLIIVFILGLNPLSPQRMAVSFACTNFGRLTGIFLVSLHLSSALFSVTRPLQTIVLFLLGAFFAQL